MPGWRVNISLRASGRAGRSSGSQLRQGNPAAARPGRASGVSPSSLREYMSTCERRGGDAAATHRLGPRLGLYLPSPSSHHPLHSLLSGTTLTFSAPLGLLWLRHSRRCGFAAPPLTRAPSVPRGGAGSAGCAAPPLTRAPSVPRGGGHQKSWRLLSVQPPACIGPTKKTAGAADRRHAPAATANPAGRG
jgi:hypothetical protein